MIKGVILMLAAVLLIGFSPDSQISSLTPTDEGGLFMRDDDFSTTRSRELGDYDCSDFRSLAEAQRFFLSEGVQVAITII